MTEAEWVHEKLVAIEQAFDKRLPSTLSMLLNDLADRLEINGGTDESSVFRRAGNAAFIQQLSDARQLYAAGLPQLAGWLRARNAPQPFDLP